MAITSLFGKYRRWNPVHPTFGAFWGFGVGLGCGVGWGPGFGPEVVGFVGSGCGVGFNVGITFVGVGVGLPSSGFTRLPWNAVVGTGKGASNVALSFVFPTLVLFAKQSREALSFQAAALERGIQNLYNGHFRRSKKYVLESRKRFPRKAQDSRKRGVTSEDGELQCKPLDVHHVNDGPPKPQTVSLTSSRRAGSQISPRDFLPPASRQGQSQDLPGNSKGDK